MVEPMGLVLLELWTGAPVLESLCFLLMMFVGCAEDHLLLIVVQDQPGWNWMKLKC